jgi:hypothetical protein
LLSPERRTSTKTWFCTTWPFVMTRRPFFVAMTAPEPVLFVGPWVCQGCS